jgi:hypothetical protein
MMNLSVVSTCATLWVDWLASSRLSGDGIGSRTWKIDKSIKHEKGLFEIEEFGSKML